MSAYITTIVGFILALSGWGKVLYDHVTSRPKVRGRIFQMMMGQMAHPEQKDRMLAAFIAYIYLVNKRRNTIHILDYELEIKVRGNWVRLARVYGLHNVENYFAAIQGGNIQIKNFEENLIYRKGKPVEYGQPLHGWVVFVGPTELYGEKDVIYRLTCIDAFNKRHRIITHPKEFGNLFLLQDMADIKAPLPKGL